MFVLYREILDVNLSGLKFFAAIHRTVSAVLQLGNMQFKEEKNQDQATMPDDTGKVSKQYQTWYFKGNVLV